MVYQGPLYQYLVFFLFMWIIIIILFYFYMVYPHFNHQLVFANLSDHMILLQISLLTS
jgi:hypothetical protein